VWSIDGSRVFRLCTWSRTSRKLEKWRKTLSTIQTMLDDAEEKQLTERAVKEWLSDLKDLAYDVDDIVDELTT
jgi:macrodomain Ter protein organizer (MatP/YcbG family)